MSAQNITILLVVAQARHSPAFRRRLSGAWRVATHRRDLFALNSRLQAWSSRGDLDQAFWSFGAKRGRARSKCARLERFAGRELVREARRSPSRPPGLVRVCGRGSSRGGVTISGAVTRPGISFMTSRRRWISDTRARCVAACGGGEGCARHEALLGSCPFPELSRLERREQKQPILLKLRIELKARVPLRSRLCFCSKNSRVPS